MRYRFGAMSARPFHRHVRVGAGCVAAALLFCFLGTGLLADLFQTSAASPMQLVRLNVNQDSGVVRIEITADNSFDDATIEQWTRGRETVIRIRGARSLLRAAYTIDDQLAHGVRVRAGERDGEPYVDVLISLGDGATLAQRKSFNRLVIGIAADFAQLRRRKSPVAGAELARREAKPPSAIAAVGAPLPRAAEPSNKGTVEDAGARVNTFARDSSQEAAATVILAAMPEPSLRSRPLWSRLLGSALGNNRPAASDLSHSAPQTMNAMSANAGPSLFNFVPMTIDAPGATRGVWVPGTTAAVEDEVGGRPFGMGVLRPSFLLGGLFSDNFFYRSQTARDLGVFTFAPRLEYEIPGEERALRLAYEAKLRKLSNGRWANGHQLDFDFRGDVTPSLRIGARNHFIRSPLDPREYDPAGEVYIVGDTFNRNDFAARLDYSFGQRSRLAFDGGYNIVRWSESHIAAAPLFIDYDEITAGVSYERDISEETTATFAFTYGDTQSFEPLRPQFNGLNDNRRLQFLVGGRTQVTETSGMAVRVGYEHTNFNNAPDRNNFRGLIFDLLYRSDLTEKTNLQFAALRKTQVSAFNLEGGNARLVTTGGSARLETGPMESLKAALGVYYQQLNFPLAIVPSSTASGGVFVGDFAGERRTDHLYGFSLEGVYKMSEILRTRLVYSFSRRDSTIPVFTFNTNRFSLVFELGRRKDVRGRPF